MALSDLLKKLRREKKWTQALLAETSGVSRDLIAQVETGKGGFGMENQELIANALGVDKELLNFVRDSEDRKGKIFISHSFRDNSFVEKVQMYLSELPERDAELYIPYYDVEITAGRIELYFDDVEERPEGYIYAPQYRDCIACNVKGDSMYDKIFPGSRLYVYHLTNKKYIDFGHIYLVVLDGYRLLKYIEPHPTDETKVVLRSYNAHYKDWSVERQDIIHLFLVKGYENQHAN